MRRGIHHGYITANRTCRRGRGGVTAENGVPRRRRLERLPMARLTRCVVTVSVGWKKEHPRYADAKLSRVANCVQGTPRMVRTVVCAAEAIAGTTVRLNPS